MPTLVQFGAGNIGRSLMGDVFSDAGYGIRFVDVNDALIDNLNERRRYQVTYRDGTGADRQRSVADVSAINAGDQEAVNRAVIEADLLGVSVGKTALPHLAKSLATAIQARLDHRGCGVDLIIAENLRQPGDYLRKLLSPWFTGPFPDHEIGLVATCVGRMVPLQSPTAGRLADVVAEPASDFFGDANAFRQRPPQATGLKLVPDIDAYVDRKLFLHNMTHSALAYFAARDDPACTTIAAAVASPHLRRQAREAATEVVAGLTRTHPQTFSRASLEAYLTNLFRRYENAALGDTCTRVGRDLPRKLGRDERIVGACRLLAHQDLPFAALANVFEAAAHFHDPILGGRPTDLELDLATLHNLQPACPVEALIAKRLASHSPLSDT